MTIQIPKIAILICFLFVAGPARIFCQTLDISSGGQPTISGAQGGSVTGSSNVLNNLSVTVNFGEVSPANTNSVVRVVVPIAIRSVTSYVVRAQVSGGTNTNAQAVQRTDIGFGVNNFRAMGSNSRICTLSTHNFTTVFNNDPAATFTINAAGRVAYSSDLAGIANATTILSGPQLSNGVLVTRAANNGYIFDAILAIVPQMYAESNYSATITFTIAAGSLTVLC